MQTLSLKLNNTQHHWCCQSYLWYQSIINHLTQGKCLKVLLQAYLSLQKSSVIAAPSHNRLYKFNHNIHFLQILTVLDFCEFHHSSFPPQCRLGSSWHTKTTVQTKAWCICRGWNAEVSEISVLCLLFLWLWVSCVFFIQLKVNYYDFYFEILSHFLNVFVFLFLKPTVLSNRKKKKKILPHTNLFFI